TQPACSGSATRRFSARMQWSSSPVLTNPRVRVPGWITLAREQHQAGILWQLAPDLPGLVHTIRIRPARLVSPEMTPDPRLIRSDDLRVLLHDGRCCMRVELLPDRCSRSGCHHEQAAVV